MYNISFRLQSIPLDGISNVSSFFILLQAVNVTVSEDCVGNHKDTQKMTQLGIPARALKVFKKVLCDL